MSTTDKALHDNKLSQLVLGGGAAASILLPQAVTKAMPQLFAGIAPVTAQTLPYCTGVCGSCGGSCVGSVGVMAFLAILAKYKHQSYKGGFNMNRRDFLKLAGVSLLSLAALTMGCGSFNAAKADAPAPKVKQSTSEGASQNMNNGKKILVAYFSWSGNTKAVAEEIHKQVGGDIVEIVPATPYSETYSVTVAKAKAEQAANARPAISTKIADFDKYDVVFLGYPNWWGSFPMPVATFVETYKLDGKTVAPFFTHGGGGEQRCLSDLQKLTPNAKFTQDLVLSGSSSKNAQGQIKSWLDSLQF